jgi:effector-binding domain-containing protein
VNIEIIEKKTDEKLIAGIRFILNDVKTQVPEFFKTIKEACGDKIRGSPFLIYYFDTQVEGGQDVEACYQVSEPVDDDRISIKDHESSIVHSITYKGSYEDMIQNARKVLIHLHNRGVRSSLFMREIFHKWEDLDQNSEIEIQVIPHNWIQLFSEGLDKAGIDETSKHEILRDQELITNFTNLKDRVDWTKNTLTKLEQLVTYEQAIEAVSNCGQKYPEENIIKLKKILSEDNLQHLITQMIENPIHMAPPVQDGNILYFTKAPANKQGFDEAKSLDEKRPQACWVSLAKQCMLNNLDLQSIFCYTSARWFKRPWESLLGIPVTVKMITSALNGDEKCTFAVHLPEELFDN